MKTVIYQVLVRLFGNTCTRNVPYGTKQENGVGKFSDLTDAALEGIKQLGTTHIWLTGVPPMIFLIWSRDVQALPMP